MKSVWRVFDLSLGQMLWSRRSALLALAAAAPVGLAILIRLAGQFAEARGFGPRGPAFQGGPMIYAGMVWFVYVKFIVPVLGVFYGTSLVADEVDDKTITYLFTRPIRRSAIVLGKYAAYLVCALLLILPSAVIVYFVIMPMGGSIGAQFPALLTDLGMLAVGLAAYGALFAYLGARLKRSLVAGLVFALGWEPAVLLFPGYLKRLTIAFYLQALIPQAIPSDPTDSSLAQLFSEIPSAGPSLAWLLVLTVLALWAAARAIETREYVLDQ